MKDKLIVAGAIAAVVLAYIIDVFFKICAINFFFCAR